ncbi:MAG: SMP-30/gluconolactonase/LRE family protein [Planctomycetes bacterium]|nr:SMP-30/gluconolactonase/LRE family protein [Planctomycetota bacterium]
MLSMQHAAAEAPKTIGEIVRHDPAMDKLLPQDAKIEVLADGFDWSEGPVWVPSGAYLLFSDIPRNHIVKWKEGEGTSIFMERLGYTGKKPFAGPEPGTNGLMLDSEGRLVACCHGDRKVKRVEKDGSITVLAARYKGKRLNSPNDLVYHTSGNLYFTDPPYGLPQRENDPARELEWFGVYRLDPPQEGKKRGKLTLLTKEMTRPNGIALSPDEKTLYVAQSDPQAAIWKVFPVKEGGTLGESRLLNDATESVGKRPGLPDGMAVDQEGNIWATGPGGVYVFNPEGKLLGNLWTNERTANCTFGGDGSTLYITADMYLCRVKTNVKGAQYDRPPYAR